MSRRRVKQERKDVLLGFRDNLSRAFAAFLLGTLMLWTIESQAQSTGSLGTNLANTVQDKQPIPEYIQEFFLSEAVRNQDQGEFQFTLGSDKRRGLGSNLDLDIEYGLTDRIQISSETPYGFSAFANSETPLRWSTTSIGLNYQILRNNSPFALTAGMSFGIPVKTGAGTDFEPKLLAAKTFHRVQVHASLIGDVENGDSSLQYNLASIGLVSHRWFPTLEFNGRRLNNQNGFYTTPGLYRHLPHRTEIGVGIPVGISGVAGRVGFISKITWEFGGDDAYEEESNRPNLIPYGH